MCWVVEQINYFFSLKKASQETPSRLEKEEEAPFRSMSSGNNPVTGSVPLAIKPPLPNLHPPLPHVNVSEEETTAVEGGDDSTELRTILKRTDSGSSADFKAALKEMAAASAAETHPEEPESSKSETNSADTKLYDSDTNFKTPNTKSSVILSSFHMDGGEYSPSLPGTPNPLAMSRAVEAELFGHGIRVDDSVEFHETKDEWIQSDVNAFSPMPDNGTRKDIFMKVGDVFF